MTKKYLDSMFNKNKNLVLYVIKRMNIDKNRYDFDDIVSYGNESLCEAINSYDESKGEFSTLAFKWIRNNIRAYLKKQRCVYNHQERLDVCIEDGEENTYYSISDIISDDKSEIESKEERVETIDEILASLVATSSVREQDMFVMRCLGYKQREISNKTKVCQSRVSRILNRVIRRIKYTLSLIDRNEKFPSRVRYITGKEYRKAFSDYYSKRFNKKQYTESSNIEKLEKLILGV